METALIQKKGIKIVVVESLPAEIDILTSIPSSIVKGDAKFMSIAAASVLAKTYRDDYMNRIHEEFPCTTGNKIGYPTKEHWPLENTALLNTIE
jgi:ribonuclease HII